MSGENHATVQISSADALDVRSFRVSDRMSDLFEIHVLAVSSNGDIDFDEVVGAAASFQLRTQWTSRTWKGVCSHVEQVRVEAGGLALYQLTLVPSAWLLTQRSNYRIFQMKTELDVVKAILGEHGIKLEERVDAASYKPRKYIVQYGETDHAFTRRLLESAGVSTFFESQDGETVMVLDDAPHKRDVKKPLLRFHDAPSVTSGEWITNVEVARRVRPGKVTVGDVDYRRASDSQPRLSGAGGGDAESRLEHYHHAPGAFLFKQNGGGGSTPSADDRGTTRTDEGLGTARTQARLDGARGDALQITFESNALDLAPGTIMSSTDHPHRAVAMGKSLLVTSVNISGNHDGEWRADVDAAPAEQPYRPAQRTPKPTVLGLESATIVGPDGEEIHTDEYARVRVHFHWDREGKRNEESSCWLPTNQPWAGAGFGGVNLPRIGQEVMVQFLGGDPDRPVVVGRVYTETQGTPYKLPKFKNVSGLRSESSPRLLMGAADGGAGLDTSSLLGGGTPLSPSQLAELVTADGPFKAASPNGQAHQWRGSELTLDDTAGKEITYFQAQKDFNLVVKNAWTTVVTNHRATRIGTDEKTTIGNKQQVDVTADRVINVTGKEDTRVDHEIVTKTNATYSMTAKSFIAMKSERRIRFEVGSSYVTIFGDNIVIQASKVDINPPG